MHKTLIAVALFLAAALPAATFANPCNGIDHDLSSVPTGQLIPVLASQMGAQSLKIQAVMKKDSWTMLRVLPVHMEPAALFFSSDPLKNHYVYLWGGIVTDTDADEKATRDGLLKSMPDMPPALATCFAWYARHGFTLD